MNRRSLLKLLLATPIAATLDVEKLLWVPKPIITVPALSQPWILRVSDNPTYSFGFTGFKPGDDVDGIVGQILWHGQFPIERPRTIRTLYGRM